jgi:predicted metal-dependent enzyme (double-stranded beta helix superfamily)
MARSGFEVAGFIDACRAAVAEPDAQRAVRELLAEALSDRPAVTRALGDPEHAGVKTLYRAPDLTVIDFTWPPWMCLRPHNHNMWSVIGIVFGREDNVFWRRTDRSIEAAGAKSLAAGDLAQLGPDIVHSVTNPIGKMTRTLHVYGGDFFAPVRPRSEWDAETLVERPWDIEATRRDFADAEARARATVPSLVAESAPRG